MCELEKDYDIDLHDGVSITISHGKSELDGCGRNTILCVEIREWFDTTLKVYVLTPEDIVYAHTVVMGEKKHNILPDKVYETLGSSKNSSPLLNPDLIDGKMLILLLDRIDSEGIPSKPGEYHDSTGSTWIITDEYNIIDEKGKSFGWRYLPLALLASGSMTPVTRK